MFLPIFKKNHFRADYFTMFFFVSHPYVSTNIAISLNTSTLGTLHIYFFLKFVLLWLSAAFLLLLFFRLYLCLAFQSNKYSYLVTNSICLTSIFMPCFLFYIHIIIFIFTLFIYLLPLYLLCTICS